MTEHYIVASTVAAFLGAVSLAVFFKFHVKPSRRGRETHITKDESSFGEEKDALSVAKESEFPTDWFTSTEIFNLETRAIFCKSWIFITHVSRFSKPGDYHSFSLSNYAIFLIMGKDHKIRAFHNVCRHRAYTVTRKESGSSTVIGCKYHGWSYDTKGRLIKAPMFDGVPGFKKEDNSLFEIETNVSDSGAVWVNLDTGVRDQSVHEGTKTKADEFLGSKQRGFRWIDGRTVEGGFNWKKAVNPTVFNIGHPKIPRSAILSWLDSNREETAALHLFPNSTLYKIPGTVLWYSVTVLPSSPVRSQIRYDIYSGSTKPQTVIENSIKTQIERMISTQAQNLEHSSCDKFHNTQNKGFHNDILANLTAHSRAERTLGRKITPVMHKSQTSQKFLQAEILCKQLDCLGSKAAGNGAADEILAW